MVQRPVVTFQVIVKMTAWQGKISNDGSHEMSHLNLQQNFSLQMAFHMTIQIQTSRMKSQVIVCAKGETSLEDALIAPA